MDPNYCYWLRKALLSETYHLFMDAHRTAQLFNSQYCCLTEAPGLSILTPLFHSFYLFLLLLVFWVKENTRDVNGSTSSSPLFPPVEGRGVDWSHILILSPKVYANLVVDCALVYFILWRKLPGGLMPKNTNSSGHVTRHTVSSLWMLNEVMDFSAYLVKQTLIPLWNTVFFRRKTIYSWKTF